MKMKMKMKKKMMKKKEYNKKNMIVIINGAETYDNDGEEDDE